MSNDGAAATVIPGWYADPLGRFELRFYNGRQWTADVSTDGARFIDPLGTEVPFEQPAGTDGVATAAMVLGIIAISTAWMPFLVVVGVITAILAMSLGWTALRRARRSGASRGRAIVGLATGASALVAGILGVLLTVIVYDVYDEYIHPQPHDTAVVSCELVGSRATMTGEITNLGDSTADFGVSVAFVRSGTNDIRRTTHVRVSDVDPGDTAEFDAQGQVDLESIDCEIIEVTGPLPFGLELD